MSSSFFHFYTFVLLFSSDSVSQRRSSRSGNVTHSLTDSEICSAYLNQLVWLITVTRCLPNGPKWFPKGPKSFPVGPKWLPKCPRWLNGPNWYRAGAVDLWSCFLKAYLYILLVMCECLCVILLEVTKSSKSDKKLLKVAKSGKKRQKVAKCCKKRQKW